MLKSLREGGFLLDLQVEHKERIRRVWSSKRGGRLLRKQRVIGHRLIKLI